MENAMSLKELSDDLHNNINELLSGKMSPEQTQHLVELCSELYEKLIVLRFKAFTETITPAEKMQAVLETSEPIKIDTTPVSTPPELANQVNLIDAIKEVEQVAEQDPEESVAKGAEQGPVEGVTQGAEQDSTKEASQEEEIEDEGDDEEIVFQLIPNDEPAIEAPKGEVKPMVSLNDTFKENANQQASIAKKLEGSPISDLKKNISLNQRFQFCKDLFKGNNQEYELTLEKLNNTNRDEAMRILQTLRDKYSWNPESMAAKDFTDLVNRRYMA
ncbi:MAG: hypothetical protein NWQ44_01780 [Flavobacteriales bacterium]|jgi:hypothetical protein|nr:hypothetical protein [Flavobacteriales bacterium]MDP4730518.1 hypothetical protein [Flavobacteriales bacterium]MDP4950433.1 hypothetical protein [Flavobacteriales bacterium]